MRALISILFVAMLFGCGDTDRYEMSKDSKGRTVRLDKKTGEIAVIGDDRVVVLKGPDEQEREAKLASSLETPKTWPAIDIPQLGGVKANITTTWRDDKLAYQFFVSPLSQKIDNAIKEPFGRAAFTVEFYDASGFKVTEVRLPLKSLSRNVNDKGEGIGVSGNDSVALPSSSYSKITNWNILWSF